MSYEDFLIWARKRENLAMPDDFYAYEDAYQKAEILLKEIKDYLEPYYMIIYYNLALHYIIVAPFMDDNTLNPLYEKYKIMDKNFITESVSDNGSSAKMHINSAMDNGDWTMLDLIRTPYGKYVYSILEQLRIYPILL